MDYCNNNFFDENFGKQRYKFSTYKFDNFGNVIADSIEDLIYDKFVEQKKRIKNFNKKIKLNLFHKPKKNFIKIDPNIRLQYKNEPKRRISNDADKFLDSIGSEENSHKNLNLSCESKNNNFIVHFKQNGFNKAIKFIINVKENDDKETKDIINDDNNNTTSQMINRKEKNSDFLELNHNLNNFSGNYPLISKNKFNNNIYNKNFGTIKSTVGNKLFSSLNKNNYLKNENYDNISHTTNNNKLYNSDQNLVVSNDYKNNIINVKKLRLSQSSKQIINKSNNINNNCYANSYIFDNTCSYDNCFISKNSNNKNFIKTIAIDKEKKQLNNKICISKIDDANYKVVHDKGTKNKKYLRTVVNKFFFVSKECVKESNKLLSIINKTNFKYYNQNSILLNKKKNFINNRNNYSNNYNTMQDITFFKNENNSNYYTGNQNLNNYNNYHLSRNINKNIKHFRYQSVEEFPTRIQIRIRNPVKEPIIYKIKEKKSDDSEKEKEKQNELDPNKKPNICEKLKTKNLNKNDKNSNKLLKSPKKKKKKILGSKNKKKNSVSQGNSCDFKYFKNEHIVNAMKNKNSFDINKIKRMSVIPINKSQIDAKVGFKKINSENWKQKRKSISFKRIAIKSKEGDDAKNENKKIIYSLTNENEKE